MRSIWIPHAAVPILGKGSLIAGGAGLIAEKSFAPGIYGSWDFTPWTIKDRDKTSTTT